MSREWTPLLQTDVPEIDDQHKELFARIAGFATAIAQGKGEAEVSQLSAFMESYAEHHFATEETLLEKTGFPQFAAHKAHHDYFRRNMLSIKQQLAEHPSNPEMVEKIYQLLSMWLFAHIKNMDLIWAAFLKSRRP